MQNMKGCTCVCVCEREREREREREKRARKLFLPPIENKKTAETGMVVNI